MVISVLVCSAVQTAAAARAARARGRVTRSSTRQGGADSKASSSSSGSTQRSPWPTSRITQGSDAWACTHTAEPSPWPHGDQSRPLPVVSAGRAGFQKASGSRPPVPRIACQPEAKSGRGMKSVSRTRKRNNRRPGRSVRYNSTAASTPVGRVRARVPRISSAVLRTRERSRAVSVQASQAEGLASSWRRGSSRGRATSPARRQAIASRQRRTGTSPTR